MFVDKHFFHRYPNVCRQTFVIFFQHMFADKHLLGKNNNVCRQTLCCIKCGCLSTNTFSTVVVSGNQDRNQQIGAIGEEVASDYLRNHGFQILARNVRNKFGELDIVARENKELVVVEVKTLRATEGGLLPEDNLTHRKRMRLARSAQAFVATRGDLVAEQGWRIDVISILLSNIFREELLRDGGEILTKSGYYCVVRHYRNAVGAGGMLP
ncbi:hypothetical protein D6779_06095 [Candidatus Parcubacteria bacterium]|nr:MAG: hypothetical protein D6779_06095 [Candidatus Parcubacteria bacterium]